jgi:hypothetical protein
MEDEKPARLAELVHHSPQPPTLGFNDADTGNSATAYEKKAMVLNEAIQEIGMGRYQWYL